MKNARIDGDFEQPDTEIISKIFNEHRAKRFKEIMVKTVNEPIDFSEQTLKIYTFLRNDVADSYYYLYARKQQGAYLYVKRN